jgi:hypothetical protein
MNNTSVILLFEVGKAKFLFPGAAQIENWEFALGKKELMKLLADLAFYKVGHHGSRNTTPKSLWTNFMLRSKTKRSVKGALILISSPARMVPTEGCQEAEA